MRKVGMLAIVIVSVVARVSAVPRYSASVSQVADSSNNVAAQYAPIKMNSERGGVGKEIIVDALKGCRDGATIGIASGSLKGGVAGGVAGGPSGVVAGAAAGALSGAAAGCVNGMITGVAKGAAVRAINATSPTTSNETPQNPIAAIRQTAQTCQSGTRYITCAYTREIKTLGKPAHVVAGDKGLHYQLIIFDKNTGKAIASHGKTTWKGTPLIGQGTMLMEKPDVKDGYNPIPKWCIESESMSVLPPEGYVIGGKDCREYADRIKDDLIKNHGGKEISVPTFALLEVTTKHSPDTSKTIASSKPKMHTRKENTFEYLLSGNVIGAKFDSEELTFENKQFLWGDENGEQNFEYDLDSPKFGLRHVMVNLGVDSKRAQSFTLIFEDRNMVLDDENNKKMLKLVTEFAEVKETLERMFGIKFTMQGVPMSSKSVKALSMKASTKYCDISFSSSVVNHADRFNGGSYASVLFMITFDCKRWVLSHQRGSCSISDVIKAGREDEPRMARVHNPVNTQR